MEKTLCFTASTSSVYKTSLYISFINSLSYASYREKTYLFFFVARPKNLLNMTKYNFGAKCGNYDLGKCNCLLPS